MSIKNELIQKVNEFISKYAYRSSHNGVGINTPYQSLQLIDVYFDSIKPENMDTEDYEYKALVHEFRVDDNKYVKLVVLEEDAGYHGIFAVENVNIFFTLQHGTEVIDKNEISNNDEESYEDYQIAHVFNSYGYFREVFDEVYDLMWRKLEDELKTEYIDIDMAKRCYPGVVKVEAVSPYETKLIFSTNATLTIANTELDKGLKYVNL